MRISSTDIKTAIWASFAAFGAYFSMYAFRKPFAAATFSGYSCWGMDFKILLVISQLLGYLLSKFIGVKVISELKKNGRITLLLGLLIIAELALIGFAIIPPPYNFPMLFLNGLPLGMVFGIVFSFLEGRRLTELMSLGLGVSIIFASGAVKSVGKILLDDFHISPFWMPAVTGLLFVPLLGLSAWALGRIPPPSAADLADRNERMPMNATDRRRFFNSYASGIVLLVFIYVLLTILRDIRDNFAVEIWATLGVSDSAGLLAKSELWISILVLAAIGLLSFVRKNQLAFQLTLIAVISGGAILGFSTYFFHLHVISPMTWMVAAGFGLFLSYTVFQGILFERMIAAAQETANVGFLMYLADTFGYLGSAGVLVWRNFGAISGRDWSAFFGMAAYWTAFSTVFLGIAALYYFENNHRFKVLRRAKKSEAITT